MRKRYAIAAAHLLCVLALLLRFPAPASAASYYSVGTFADLKSALQSTNTPIYITLTASIQFPETLTTSRDFSLRSESGQQYTLSRATGFIGAFFKPTTGTVNLYDVILDGTYATTTASLITMTSYSNVYLNSGTVLENNHTADSGGAVYNTGGTVFVRDGAVIRNNTADIEGGGILSKFAAYVSAGARITGNTAMDGGGIANGGYLSISGGSVDSNHAASWGGGISNFGGQIYMTGGSVDGNTADFEGGGIYNMGVMTATGGSISDNYAYWNGGGIYINGGSSTNLSGPTTVSGNEARFDGGGVWVAHDWLSVLDVGPAVVFSDNKAQSETSRDPADDATYAAHIQGTQWTSPLTQGYNNTDIAYVDGVPVHEVNFYPRNGTGVTQVVVDDGDTVPQPPDPVRDGYRFDGWYKNQDDPVPYDFSSPVTDNMNIFAMWTKICRVDFDSGPGSPVASQTVYAGDRALEPPDPELEGYTFEGWYIDGSDIPYDFSGPVTGDLTLHARWKEIVPPPPEPPAPEIPPTGDTGLLPLYCLCLLSAGLACALLLWRFKGKKEPCNLL